MRTSLAHIDQPARREAQQKHRGYPEAIRNPARSIRGRAENDRPHQCACVPSQRDRQPNDSRILGASVHAATLPSEMRTAKATQA